MTTRRWIAVGCASIWLAAPAPVFAASASAAGAQQLLPQEQQQTRAAQSSIEQMQQQWRALHRQFVENQQAFDRIQQAAPPHSPYEALPFAQTVTQAQTHVAVLNHAAVSLQGLVVQSQQQAQAVQATADRAARLAVATQRQESLTQAQTVKVRQLLNGQLQFVEEHGSVGYLSVLFGAHSFPDFLSRIAWLSALLGQTTQLQGQLQTQAGSLRREAQQLVQVQQLMHHMQQDLAQHQTLLSQEKTVLQYAIREAAAQIQSAQIQAALAQYRDAPVSRPALYRALYPLIAPLAQQDHVPPSLIIAVITEESGGNAHAVSHAGAIGLMQLEPGTAAMLGTNPHALTNPQVNVVAGCLYLHDLLTEFHGRVSLALSGYNAGPGAVTANHDHVVACTTGYVRTVEAMAAQYAAMR